MPHAQNFETPWATSHTTSLARAARLLVLLGVLVGCGSAPVERPKTKLAPYAAEPDSLRYPQSLRQAALGRVHQRAGFDALAAEYFRSAYRAYPQLTYVLDYAQASERARHFAEAHAAYAQALQHQLGDEQRKRIVGEVERLKTLVSPSLVPVAVQVQPQGARVVFSAEGEGEQNQRVMLGDGSLWLRPGTYQIDGTAAQHHGLKRTFRVGTHERQLLSIHLRRQTLTSSSIAVGAPAAVGTAPAKSAPIDGAPTKTVVVSPTPAPAEADEPTAPAEAAPVVAKAAAPAEAAAAAEPPAVDDGPIDGEENIEESTPMPTSSGGNAFWGPVVTAGLGVAGLGAGAYFGSMMITYAGYANDLKNPKGANYKKNLAEQTQLAQDNADYATWAFIGGGALVAAGTAWFILDRALGSSASHLKQSAPAVALRPAGFGFDGRRFMATWRF